MIIAILGGTGPEGAGLGLRWADAGHQIVIGSRVQQHAIEKAEELNRHLGTTRITGGTNAHAAATGDLVVLAIPYAGLSSLLPEIKGSCRGKIVVSTVVPLTFGAGRLFTPPPAGSAAEEAQTLLGAEAPVVAGFHHIAAHALQTVTRPIQSDLLLAGNNPDAKQVVADLGRSIGLRVLDAGPLSNAGPLEGITALLVTFNHIYKTTHSGIAITGISTDRAKAERSSER